MTTHTPETDTSSTLTLTSIEGGWRVKENAAGSHYVDVLRMAFNLRIALTPKDAPWGYDRYWCYAGTDHASWLRTVLTAHQWDGALDSDPPGWNKNGRPIPWFVSIDDNGTPDFRLIRRDGIEDAYRFQLCWVCGQPRGRFAAFTIGPMCAINRTSAEPPAHRDCAIYSARACPFLATPTMQRRERGLPEERHVAGVMITRNPGVALVWITRDWAPFQAPNGVLFELGDPIETLWYAHGRHATRAEIQHSIDTGLPILEEAAAVDGPFGIAELARRIEDVETLLPAHPSITCPRCQRTSHNPHDIAEGYCGACHDWTSPRPADQGSGTLATGHPPPPGKEPSCRPESSPGSSLS